jgi:predicted O-methyltransferase YrrM
VSVVDFVREKLKNYLSFARIHYGVVFIVVMIISLIATFGNLAPMMLSFGMLLGFVLVFRGLSVIHDCVNQHINSMPSQVKHVSANVYALMKLNERFPHMSSIMTTWSIEPVHLQYLISIMDEHRPKRIVELGCGVSTLVVSAWLKENGGSRCVSIEHSDHWAHRTRIEVDQFGLRDYADIKVIPLQPMECLGECMNWHVPNSVKSCIDRIDLLLVDGPPAVSPLTRLPALPVLHEKLSQTAVILLDDGNRPGEKEVVKHWLQIYEDLTAELLPSSTGLWVIRRSPRKEMSGPFSDQS